MSYSENGGTPFNMNVVPAGGAGYGGDFLVHPGAQGGSIAYETEAYLCGKSMAPICK